jgi:hypothetical protein
VQAEPRGAYKRSIPGASRAQARNGSLVEVSDQSFDLAAAGLRADGSDLRISLEVLASKLEQALPGSAHVERSGGGLLGRGEKRVRLVRVDLGETRYRLTIDGHRVEGSRERQVGGISIKREQLEPSAWLAALTEDLQTEAQRNAEVGAALRGLLG